MGFVPENPVFAVLCSIEKNSVIARKDSPKRRREGGGTVTRKGEAAERRAQLTHLAASVEFG